MHRGGDVELGVAHPETRAVGAHLRADHRPGRRLVGERLEVRLLLLAADVQGVADRVGAQPLQPGDLRRELVRRFADRVAGYFRPRLPKRANPIELQGGATVRLGTASWTDPTMTAGTVFYPKGADSAEERLTFDVQPLLAIIEQRPDPIPFFGELLFWLFLSAFAVLLGAELNAELELQTRRDTTVGPPQPLGQRGAYVADNVAGSPDNPA